MQFYRTAIGGLKFSVTLPEVQCGVGHIFHDMPFGKFVSSDGMPYTIHIDWRVAGVSLCVAAAGIALALSLIHI